MADATSPRDPTQIVQHLRNLVRQLENLGLEDFKGQQLVRDLAEMGFFSTNADLMQKIVDRLKEDQGTKRVLGKYLASDLQGFTGKQLGSIFIESGSTLAYFAQSLAKNREICLPEIFTNNFLVQTLLFGRTEVSVTPGYLRETYLAYLPFALEPRGPMTAINVSAKRRAQDRINFYRLGRLLSSIKHLFVTASTFGFLIGPMTGTRDNAIFKYCAFNNRAGRKIKFCIVDTKIFKRSTYEWPRDDLQSKCSVPRHLNSCRLVFDLDLSTDDGASRPHSHNVLPERAVDGNALIEDWVQRFDPDETRRPDAQVLIWSAPSELGLERCGMLYEKSPIYGTYDTWLNFLDNQQSETVEIVVGCGTKNGADEVREAANDANKFLNGSGYRFRYQEDGDPIDDIVHLKVVR